MRKFMAVTWVAAALVLMGAATAAPRGGRAAIRGAVPTRGHIVHTVRPSEANPSVARFDEPSVVLFNRDAGAQAPLVLFMTGTGGKPKNVELLLSVVADLGYRALALAYNDEPAVVQVCPRNPDPGCSAKVRQRRIYGDAATDAIDDTVAEAIVPRLTALLKYLDAEYPDEGWKDYLDGDAPRWGHMVVSGLSQGAGMAAYIAKQKPVARVVLLSSPWDFYGPSRTLAPWLAAPSATPPERWYAAYHTRENTADLLPAAYAMLGVPSGHIAAIDTELPERMMRGNNPYHATMAQNPAYVPVWQALFGKPVE